MNSKILVPRIGTISVKQNIGGETKVEEVIPPIKMEDAPINQYYLYASSELVRFVRKLKMEESQLPRKYKLINGIVERNSSEKDEIKKTILLRKIRKIEEILNRRKVKGFRKIKFSLSTKELQSLVQYEIKNLNPTILNQSMIRMEQKPIYEIEKGDKMNKIVEKTNYYNVPTKDGKRKFNRVVEESVLFHSWNGENEGSLKNKDIMVLYFSRRIGIFNHYKKEFEPLMDKVTVHHEDQIIPNVREMMKHPRLLYVRIRDELIPIKQLERKVFNSKDKQNKALSFVLNLKGEAMKVTDCRYYDSDNKKQREIKALSYNLIDYETNHIVVIARQATLTHLNNRLNRLHKEYKFLVKGKDGYFKEPQNMEKYKYNENEKFFAEKTEDFSTKIEGLSRQEGSVVKNRHKRKDQFDESEIMELFEYLKDDIDGRETVRNMEHDIRNHYQMKYLLQKSSKELFILKLVLEDTREYAEDLLTEEEMARFDLLNLLVGNAKSEATKRKMIALTNIVSGLHLRIEEEEDMGRYLSDELDEIDKVSHDRESKYYKTHRNYYSQKEGILVPNGNPQTTHKRKSNPPSMERIRILKEQNRKQHKVDDLIKRIMSFEEEKEMFWKVNPSKKPEVKREYPWYPIKDILGLDKEDKDVFLPVLKEVEGYLSKAKASFVKDAIIEALKLDREEKITPPSFKLPSYCYPEEEENPLLEICNSCPNEGKCFIEKTKRINSPLISNKKIEGKMLGYYNPKERRAYVDVLKIKERKNAFALLAGIIGHELVHEYTHRNNMKRNEFYAYSVQEKIMNKLHVKMSDTHRKIKEKHFEEMIPRSTCTIRKIGFYLKEQQIVEFLFDKLYQKSLTIAKEFIKIEKPKLQLKERTVNRIRGKSPSPRSINQIGEDEYFVREYSKDGKVFSFYAKGNIEALTSYEKISFTGGRNPTEKTIKFVQEKVDEFSDEYVIVSGLASGCDTISHKRCLENFGITIAVLPCGFNNIYPEENKELANQIIEEGGLLISEYKPETKVSKKNLVERNRIIAGISDKVVIAKGGKGTKHTRGFAAENGKTMIFQPKD